MLFVNISSDNVHLTDGIQEHFLERNGIENTLGPVLVQWYRERPYSQIFVLNGPGGFTNLRVGVLDLNLLNVLLGSSIQIFTCTKIDFYTYCIKQRFLPNCGLLYLGQKKNVWKLDMDDTGSNISLVTLYEISAMDTIGFVDYVGDPLYWGQKKDLMVSFVVKNDKIVLFWKGKSLIITPQELGLLSVSEIKAEYLMEVI